MIVKQSYFFQIDSFLNNYSKLRKVKKRFLQSFLKNIKQLKKSRNTKVNKSYVNELRKRKKSITQGIFSFNFARNNTIVTLDGDGQNDPKDIFSMLEVWKDSKKDKELLVIGHRVNRKDTWSRRYASLLALKVRKFILKDSTPDSGCGIKIFSRNLFLSLPYFDHIHRFLPALTRRHGGTVVSHAVSHRNRLSGISKYSNFQRFKVGVIDLFGVSWLIKRSSFPIKVIVETKEN